MSYAQKEFHLALKKQIISFAGKRCNWRSSHRIKGNKTDNKRYIVFFYLLILDLFKDT